MRGVFSRVWRRDDGYYGERQRRDDDVDDFVFPGEKDHHFDEWAGAFLVPAEQRPIDVYRQKQREIFRWRKTRDDDVAKRINRQRIGAEREDELGHEPPEDTSDDEREFRQSATTSATWKE